jgi:hypothetical protein
VNPRWIIWPIVLVALAGLTVWIARNTYWEEVQMPQPFQGEAVTNPFYAASRLASLLGAHPKWERVLGAMPPRDAIVLPSAWHWGLLVSRRERLQSWVASGGRLVIDRSLIGGQKELADWAGVSRYVLSIAALNRADRETHYEKCPTLTAGSGVPPTPAQPHEQFKVCGLDRISALSSARKPEWILRDASSGIQALRVPIGRGSVTFINSSPFGNAELLEGDDAALFVAATQLRRGDSILFLTEEPGASLLSLIWATGAPVVMLAAALVAAWLWRSSARFGPPAAPTEQARRSLAEQIRGTGEFTLRFGGGRALYAAQVRALQETAERRIPGYSRLSGAERIDRLGELTGIQSSTLASALNLSSPRRQGELRHGLALLESIRRTLSSKPNAWERS